MLETGGRAASAHSACDQLKSQGPKSQGPKSQGPKSQGPKSQGRGAFVFFLCHFRLRIPREK